jgi:hypothetical protein
MRTDAISSSPPRSLAEASREEAWHRTGCAVAVSPGADSDRRSESATRGMSAATGARGPRFSWHEGPIGSIPAHDADGR